MEGEREREQRKDIESAFIWLIPPSPLLSVSPSHRPAVPPSPMTHAPTQPVLILGAGINGACVARELVLNGVPVVVADVHDIAAGATSKSSRLIHGGVRYLEYGDIGLVRESLEERARLLSLAPHCVRPLRLHIPIRRRHGGLLQSGVRFLKFDRHAFVRWLSRRLPVSERGLWTVRIGLWLYDRIARDSTLPEHAVHRVDDADSPQVDRAQYRWTCAYSDAQILYPERFVIALLDDARREADRSGVEFRVLTYHHATRQGEEVRLTPLDESRGPAIDLRPSTIVNATGAGGDFTLRELGVESPPLFGGTKGSHIITRQPALLQALRGQGVYAEAADGRLVFVLPFSDAVLVGTTDIPCSEPPAQAVASEDEVQYLVGMVNEVFPQVALQRDDVAAHYCGVRPLPNVNAARAGAIPRGHWIDTNVSGPVPIDTLIGGKLTTCRAFGEAAADRILARLGRPRTMSTRDRPIPGAGGAPDARDAQTNMVSAFAQSFQLSQSDAQAAYELVGSQLSEITRVDDSAAERLTGTPLPVALVDWIIEHEWVSHVEDLVERRLMLAWSPSISISTLQQLAERLAAAGRIQAAQIDQEVAAAAERLQRYYGNPPHASV